MTRLLLILLFIASTVYSTFAQNDFLLRKNKVLPTDKHWTDLQLQFNFIPDSWIKKIEQELDSTISATDCYKFIYNEDTTKFIAFFIMHRDNAKFDRLRHFGRAVHQHYRPSADDSILFLSYVLFGMKYDQNWYYHKEYESEFWDKTDNSGKNDFLFYVLNDIGFLKHKYRKTFWKNGGEINIFRTKYSVFSNDYPGLPEIVGWHKIFEIRRKNDLLNEQIEKIACSVEDDLWNKLHHLDSVVFHSRFISKYSGKSCLVLYNSARNNILLPILYYDSNAQPWISYYFLKVNTTDTTIYTWTKFPAKKINRKPGDEGLEVVYDIRTFIKNWGWGTANMISNDHFWNDNFKNNDLKPVEE